MKNLYPKAAVFSLCMILMLVIEYITDGFHLTITDIVKSAGGTCLLYLVLMSLSRAMGTRKKLTHKG